MPYLNRLLRLRRNTFFKSRLRFFDANFTQCENAGSCAKPSLSTYLAQRGMFISFIAVKGFLSSGTVLPHYLKQPSFGPVLAAFATLVVNNAIEGVPSFTVVVELRVQRRCNGVHQMSFTSSILVLNLIQPCIEVAVGMVFVN